jgi:hypothetical protein
MNIRHHDLKEKLPEEWWIAAGMPNFIRSASAYRCDHAAAGGRRMCLIPIVDIGPIQRNPSVPVFNANSWEGISARERVERIFHAFAANATLPPIELTKQAGRYPFDLRDGVHRLFCSIAAGYTEIPAVRFFDLAALDAGRDLEELC